MRHFNIVLTLFCLVSLLLIANCKTEGPGIDADPKEVEPSIKEQYAGIVTKKIDSVTVLYGMVSDFTTSEGVRTIVEETKVVISGNNEARFTKVIDGGNIVETRKILVGDKFIDCGKTADGWLCYQTTIDPDQPRVPTVQQVLDSMGGVEVQKLDSKMIAGIETQCFLITPPDNAEIQRCFSPQGVLMFDLVNTDDFKSQNAALAYTTEVTESDFVPPAVPVDVQDITANIPDSDNTTNSTV
ncbi:hypothetical protein JW868_03070 [Candidatus Woesearchaeota archaeon]|nr:hypothetical protein [Candidatus Woesearchaeota archaeon]